MTKRIIGAGILALILCVSGMVLLKGQFAKEAKDPREMIRLGIEYQDSGDKNKALRLFKNAVKIDPDYPQAHFFLGRLYVAMQKEDGAMEEFALFMEKMRNVRMTEEADNKAYIQCLHYISGICGDLKRYDEMKSAISEIIARDPKDQGAYYNLGVYYYNAEHDRPKAYQNFKKAADLDPNTSTGKGAKYAIEFMRNNPDSRVAPDLSFIEQEYR